MTDDKRLLEATNQGDTAAFEKLVRKYQSLVCAITFSGTARLDISEELAQEAFLSAWQNRSQLKDPEKFRPWLCSIARNLVRNHHRKKKITPVSQVDQAHLVDETPNPSEQAVSREETMILEQVLNRIPADYREPLVLFYRHQQSIRQVADHLELNEATVRTRLHRGRQMLKQQTAAIVERTLERTAPDAAFTRTVMAGIGVGFAAGAAGTATATAATVGLTGSTSAASGTILLTVAGAMTTVAGKILVAATVIITAGVAVYSYNHLSNEKQAESTQPTVWQDGSENTDLDQAPVPADFQAELQDVVRQRLEMVGPLVIEETDQPVELVEEVVLTSSRHPDWPTVDEPIDHVYMKMSDKELWVQLPRRFREEDVRAILIDNAKERLEVKKIEKTVQYSITMTSQEPPIYRYNQPLTSLEAFRFATLFGRSLNPYVNLKYSVQEIGQKESGAVLVYSMQSKGSEDSNYEVTAYVDAVTRLPEEMVVINVDPNSSMTGQVMDKVVFDFAPIPDSIFEYTPGAGQTVLPFKQKPCFRGQVVDMMGDPVAGADVFVYYFPLWGEKYLTGKSDMNGNFKIIMPQRSNENTIHMPIYFWATVPDNPVMTGWTILDRTDHPRYERISDLMSGFGGTVVQSGDPIEMIEETEDGLTTYHQRLTAFLKDPVLEDVRLVMEPAGEITGYVTDQQGNVISDVKIDLEFQVFGSDPGIYIDLTSSNINWEFSSTTNAEGYYQFNGLPAFWKNCRYMLKCSAAGYVSEVKELKLAGPLESQEFNVSLSPQFVAIRGILTDNYGIPLEKRRISLSVPKMAVQNCSTTTDPNGCFVLEGCPDVPGMKIRSDLSWMSPPYNPVNEKLLYNAFRYYPEVFQEVPYIAGQREYFIEMTAIRPETKVEVLVTDSAGNPLPEYMVKMGGLLQDTRRGDIITYEWQQHKLEKRTDANGKIVFDNIPDLKEIKLIVSPEQHFIQEMHALNDKQKERLRLEQIDRAYRQKYQAMEVPVELIEGQTDYSVHVVVLTQEEFQALPAEDPS